MSGFTEPLAYASTDVFKGGHLRPLVVDGAEVVELTGGRRLFRVVRGFRYACDRTGLRFDVPTGFVCDLGSIPGIARGLLAPDDPWAQAYVLHDWLYRSRAVDRLTADLILWDALGLPYRAYTETGQMVRAVCPALYRAGVYYAVRVGGSRAYSYDVDASIMLKTIKTSP